MRFVRSSKGSSVRLVDLSVSLVRGNSSNVPGSFRNKATSCLVPCDLPTLPLVSFSKLSLFNQFKNESDSMHQSIQAKAHLVGSFPAKDAESAMRTTLVELKDLLVSVPDGETGWRYYFTAGLFQKIVGQSPELGAVWRGYNEQLNPLPAPQVDEVTQQTILDTIASHQDLDFGYADEAIASYQTFLKLEQEGVITKNV